MVDISYVKTDTATFCKGHVASLTRTWNRRSAGKIWGQLRIERPGRVCCREAEHLTVGETWINLLVSWLRSSNRTVLADAVKTAVVRSNMREIVISMLET